MRCLVFLRAAAVLLAFGAAADARTAVNSQRPGPVAAAAGDIGACNTASGDTGIAACSRVIARNPKNASAWYSRALAYERNGDHDRAVADLDRALDLDPQYARAYTERGFVRDAKGDHDRAIADYDEAIRLDPNYAVAYNNRGHAYAAKGDRDRALADFDQAIRLNPNYAIAWHGRGNVWFRKGDYDHAIADYGQAVNLDPNDALAWSDRAHSFREKHDNDRAIADYDQAIRLNPKIASAWNGRGIAWYNKNDQDRAIADFTQAITLDPKFTIALSNRGDAWRAKREFDRAIADYDQAIGISPKLAPAWYGRGIAYAIKGDYDRAIANYDQAIRFNPDSTNAYNARGYASMRKGDYDRAIADLDQAIRLNPKFVLAWANRGFSFASKGDYGRAIADYDQALAIDPNFARARHNRERAQTFLAALTAPPDPRPGTVNAAPERTTPEQTTPGRGADRRVALVIGNSQYRSAPFLANPRRDAKAVADALRDTGFESVELAMDLDRDGMVKALRTFRDKADNADWALIYYAGHGIEIDRTNYLVPIDAKLLDDRDVKAEALSYEELLGAAGGARVLRIIVLDACRTNPFKDQMRRTTATRDTSRGLAPPPEGRLGTLIVFSAKDGEVAADDAGGANSPFASAFVTELRVPGREVRRLFDFVRDDVMDATDNRQQPFTYGSLPGRRDFFFVAGK